MPKTSAQARPANLQVELLRRLLSYMGHAKFSLLVVGVLASVAAIASLAGTYMVRPIVNGLAAGGEELLTKQVILTADHLRRGRALGPGLLTDHGACGPTRGVRYSPRPVRAHPDAAAQLF